MSGYPGDVFKPTQPINRAQATIVIANVQGLADAASVLADSDAVLQRYFQDATNIPSYAKGAIAVAAEQGLVVSYPEANRLRPNDDTTRGEATALLCRRNTEGTDARHYVPAQYVAGWDEATDRLGPAAANEIQVFDSSVSIAGLLHTTAVLGDRLFFFFEAGELGSQMWVSDGTSTGTRQIKVLEEALPDGEGKKTAGVQHPKVVAVSDDRFWITVKRYSQYGHTGSEDGLWSSDGTAAGTQAVQSLNPELAQAFSAARSIEVGTSDALFQGRLPFAIVTQNETQIWLTDGLTSAGTQRLVTLDNTYPISLDQFIATSDRLYLRTLTREGNVRLWRSDGTAAGTQQIKDIDTGENRSRPRLLKTLSSNHFVLINSVDSHSLWESSETDGLNLWESSATLEPVRRIKQLSQWPTHTFDFRSLGEVSQPVSQVYQDTLFFNPLVH